VFTTIFQLFLATSNIVPVPNTASLACLNDYRPVALTAVVMKCFEGQVKEYICAVLPLSMDMLQFAYRQNRSSDDDVSQVIHRVPLSS